MKRILIPLCLVVGSHMASGQRSYQFDASNRLFVEGKELFSLKNYSGCIDKLEAYKLHSTDADLIQEADYMLVYSAYEQGRPNAVELLKDYQDVYPASHHADEVNFLIGSAHFGQGEYQKAIFWFNESNIDMLKSGTTGSLLFPFGLFLVANRRYGESPCLFRTDWADRNEIPGSVYLLCRLYRLRDRKI